MPRWSRPTEAELESFLARCHGHSFSYAPVGCTHPDLWIERQGGVLGYARAHYRIWLGQGRECFEAACEALEGWQMFPKEMVTLAGNRPAIDKGDDVALRIHALGFWTMAACRIVYRVDQRQADENGSSRNYGFAYGTLPWHLERGEERFLIQWQADNNVFYDLLAFSRPQMAWVWCGMPLARWQQRRFGHMSGWAMRNAVVGKEGVDIAAETPGKAVWVRAGT